MRTIEQMVQQEVLCCVSHIVSVLAGGYADTPDSRRANKFGPLGDLHALAEQAFELACPVADYEEAAIQAGWSIQEGDEGRGFWKRETDGTMRVADANPDDGWSNLCSEEGIEPYEWEVFEHWAVSGWFADKLIAQGEKVDKDFGGLCIWSRTTTGQNITSDDVVKRIYNELEA